MNLPRGKDNGLDNLQSPIGPREITKHSHFDIDHGVWCSRLRACEG